MTRPDPTRDLIIAVARGERPPVDLEGICPRHFRHGLFSVNGTPHCPECEREAGKVKWIEKHLDARDGAR